MDKKNGWTKKKSLKFCLFIIIRYIDIDIDIDMRKKGPSPLSQSRQAPVAPWSPGPLWAMGQIKQ
jgi:hypothetical protein